MAVYRQAKPGETPSHGTRGPPEAGGGGEDPPRSPSLIQTSGLQNREAINSCPFEPPGLWYLVIAAVEANNSPSKPER